MAFDHEYDNVMMRVGSGANALVYLGTANFRAAAKLVQFIARLVKQHMLNSGKFNSFNQFVRLSEGKFDIMNLPVADEEKLHLLFKDMEKVGIRFYEMPDLNKEDGFLQVAIMRDDGQKFNALYERYILNNLAGGNKDFSDLTNFTNGKVSLISIPYNDLEIQSVKAIQEDLDKLKINYALMPDLYVGDGKVQISVASADLPKLQHWFDLYRDDMIKDGVDVGNMEQITMDQYIEKGVMIPEQYMDTAPQEMLSKVAEFDSGSKGVLEQTIDKMENQIRSISDETYDRLKNNPNYIEITINKETLVNDKTIDIAAKVNSESQFSSYFASRIPGTFGEKEQILLLPKKHVFSTDGGQTYIAFLPNNARPMVFDSNGSLLPFIKRKTGEELFHKHYDYVQRNFENQHKNILNQGSDRIIKSVEKNLKSPIPPVKAK